MRNDLYFENVEEGDVLPSFEATITRTDIVKYAGAGGDFNPVHHDDEFAKSIGLPSVFAMGLLHGGYLTKILTDWAGPAAVRRYKIRFQDMVWPGDKITCEGKVTGKSRKDDVNMVHCAISVRRDGGGKVVEGEADIVLPSMNQVVEE